MAASEMVSLSELMQMLDADAELHEHLQQQLRDGPEPLLLSSLLSHLASSSSWRALSLLASPDTEASVLLETLHTHLIQGSMRHRTAVMQVLALATRRQLSWFSSAEFLALFKDILAALQTPSKQIFENDDFAVTFLLSSLLFVSSLLPLIPASLPLLLPELLDAFTRMCCWLHAAEAELSSLQVAHMQLALSALFHRLYALFPCNFLSYLRTNFSERDTANHLVFLHVIEPMLATVRMHPMLITLSREQEKAGGRWQACEPQDVLAAAAKFSLLPEDNFGDDLKTATAAHFEPIIKLDRNQEVGSQWTPSSVLNPVLVSQLSQERLFEEGATETAIEATPDSTSFTANQKNNNSTTSLAAQLTRRDSVFTTVGGLGSQDSSSTLNSRLRNVASDRSMETERALRPSPVRFTSRRLASTGLNRPEPDRPSLKIEPIDEPITMGAKEEEDEEVSEITGGSEAPRAGLMSTCASTRHITPMLSYSSCLTTEPHSADASPLSQLATNEEQNSETRMHEFVKRVRGRIRYHSLTANSLAADAVADEVAAVMGEAAKTSQSSMKRTCSWPRMDKISRTEEAPANPTVFKAAKGEVVTAVSVEVQTEEMPQLQPYEHLLPMALPYWFEPEKNTEKEEQQLSFTQRLDDALDQWLNAAANQEMSAKETVEAVRMLQLQLQFERQRRELFCTRNRRLLKRTKMAKAAEGENAALREQLRLVEAEAQSLAAQLETVLTAKLTIEQDLKQELEQQQLQMKRAETESDELRSSLGASKDEIGALKSELKKKSGELDDVQAALFNAKNEIYRLETKERERDALELEVLRLQQQLSLMGEFGLRQQLMLETPYADTHAGRKELAVLRDTYTQELDEVKQRLLRTGVELEASRARVKELEESVAHKDLVIGEQKRLLKIIKEQHAEELRPLQRAAEVYSELQRHHEFVTAQQAEEQRQHRQHRVHRASIHTQRQGRRGSDQVMHSANLDIQRPLEVDRNSDENRSFVVGSPPQSSNGSFDAAAEMNAVLRGRGIHSPPDVEHERRRHISPIESPASPITLGTSSTSSVNGNRP